MGELSSGLELAKGEQAAAKGEPARRSNAAETLKPRSCTSCVGKHRRTACDLAALLDTINDWGAASLLNFG